MASACVNSVGVPPESFLDCAPAYGWMTPRLSFGRQYTDEEKSIFASAQHQPEASDLFKDGGDFEFLLDDSVTNTMLPADELFSDGKLVPLQLAPARSTSISSEDEKKSVQKTEVESVAVDPNLFSPKAPKCSRHWRELLGLRKLHQKAALLSNATTTSSSSSSNAGKSIRHFLQRNSKLDASANVPLLKDSDSESLSVSSSRHSLSSSSSGPDHDDLPRLSHDADTRSSLPRCSNPGSVRPRVRKMKPRMVPAEKPLIDHPSAPTITRGVSLDSPRLSSSGKIVFHGLERSSSSPSSLNGGPRHRHRGMERSYSSNVRVTPVLNVPLCKSGVFGLFSSQSSSQKREGSSGPSRSHNHQHHLSSGCGRVRREKE